MAEHAPLGPSAAERWIPCPASIRFAAPFDTGESSEWAEEGTIAHELAAWKVADAFKGGGTDFTDLLLAEHPDLTADQVDDMRRFTDQFVNYVGQLADQMSHPQLAVEQRVDTGVDQCWGTADVVLYGPRELVVVDFKYGTGVAVEAEDNPQLKLYALGVLNAFQDLLGHYDEITVAIAQPRIGIFKSVVLDVAELEQWRDEIVKPAAALALSDGAPFGPSMTACRWCPAAGRCQAQLESIFSSVDFDDDPDTLSPAEISDALQAAPAIKAWLSQLEETALKMAYSEGTPIPGWKVVRSGGKRTIQDPAHAIQTLVDAGYPASDTAVVKLRPFGELERMLQSSEDLANARQARERLDELLGDLIVKTKGSESLVPDTDKRAAIDPNTEAVKAFEEVS